MSRPRSLAGSGELTRTGRVRDPSPRAPRWAAETSKGGDDDFCLAGGAGHVHHFRRLHVRRPAAAFLPTQHLADAKSAITTIQGLVTCCLRSVLGLLVWTSYGVYSQQQSETHTLGSQVLQLDLALERYGPTADRGRELLRQELIATRERFWGGGGARPARLAYCQSRAELRDIDAFFAGLKPSTMSSATCSTRPANSRPPSCKRTT